MRGNRLFRFIDYYLGVPIVFILGVMSKFFAKPSTSDFQPLTILVIKLSALGDTILLWPVLRTLKKQLKQVNISMIVTDINKSAVESCPYVDEKNLFDVKSVFHPFKIVKFIYSLHKKKYDLVLDFDQWLRISPIIAFLSGAKKRIGFFTQEQHRHYLYTDYVYHNKKQHELDCFFDILKHIGIEADDKHLEFQAIKILIENFSTFSCRSNLIAFHPGMPKHGQQRQWPKENFVELAKRLIRDYNYKIVIVGSGNEKKLVTRIVNDIGNKDVYSVIGLSLPALGWMLQQCKALICGNTGIMHLASACNVPVIALHGPTDPIKWGPYGEKHKIIKSRLACSPCLYLGFEYGCKTNKCMQAITVDEVINSIVDFIN